MKLDAERMIATTIIDAFVKEIQNLREWYFYEPQHKAFNALYYDFMTELGGDNLSQTEKVNVCYKYFTQAIEFMNDFYPEVCLGEDSSGSEEPEIIHPKSTKKKQGSRKKGRPKGKNKTAK